MDPGICVRQRAGRGDGGGRGGEAAGARTGTSVVVATAYMEEAESFSPDHLRSRLAALARAGTEGLSFSIQNNTVTRNVSAQAPPRLALAPGVGM